MLGDKFEVKPYDYGPGKKILDELISRIKSKKTPLSIGIGGESGCGKSTQAQALKTLLDIRGYHTIVLRMDDYFLLPPRTNHNNRLKDINAVGPGEVNLDELNENIKFIENKDSDLLVKPLINYDLNVIRKEYVEIQEVRAVIVEGTYVLLLENLNIRIFMPQNYMQTKRKRRERGRDEISSFNERVLMIEHEIIRKHHRVANYIIDSEYNIIKSKPVTSPGPHLRI